MKKNFRYLTICLSSFLFSNTYAATAIEECKQLFDEAMYEQALAPCLEAGKSGHLDSQSILGEIYDRRQNSKETYYWWNRAAQKGYIPARNQLAMKYYYGGSIFGPEKGWQQSYQTAYDIWLEDALNGHAAAQFMVAEMSHQGHGVRQDFAEAWAWFNLALEQGYKLASDSLYELSRKMSPQQKQQGEKLLSRYREQTERNQARL